MASHTPAERESRVRALLDAARRRLNCKHPGPQLRPLHGRSDGAFLCHCPACDSHVWQHKSGAVVLVHHDAVARTVAVCSSKLAGVS